MEDGTNGQKLRRRPPSKKKKWVWWAGHVVLDIWMPGLEVVETVPTLKKKHWTES